MDDLNHDIIQRDAGEFGVCVRPNICSRFRRTGGGAGETAIFYSFYSVRHAANGLRWPKAHRQADCWEQRWLEKGVVLKTVFVATDESVV